jgi:hypothetical protein
MVELLFISTLSLVLLSVVDLFLADGLKFALERHRSRQAYKALQAWDPSKDMANFCMKEGIKFVPFKR